MDFDEDQIKEYAIVGAAVLVVGMSRVLSDKKMLLVVIMD